MMADISSNTSRPLLTARASAPVAGGFGRHPDGEGYPDSERYPPRWSRARTGWWPWWSVQRLDHLRADRRAGRSALRHARIAANRIFAVEHCQLPLLQLAGLATRELRSGAHPGAAFVDSVALASIAAQRTLGLRAHLAQMAAAVLSLQDRAAELGCGEGKSLALALAAAVRALGGSPVHLVVRDDALVLEIAALMRPFFESLGLSVAAVSRAADAAVRREAYQADVCYVTAHELMFDSLRDRYGAEPIGFRQPELASVLIDDIDAVLIDGAATPCVLLQGEQVVQTTAQQFFNRYPRLGGVSGTLAEARGELASVYGLGVTPVASIYPCFRRDLGLTVMASETGAQHAVVERVRDLVASRRPVLVATHSDAACSALLAALHDGGIDAAAISGEDPVDWRSVRDAAGTSGRVTVCAGARGRCDAIALDSRARAAGGLAVIATYLGSSRREDRQLGHLTGRQGQPGSVETIAVLAMPAALAPLPVFLPAFLMRSLARGGRYLRDKRAQRLRNRRARRLSALRRAEITMSARPPTHLQHEGR